MFLVSSFEVSRQELFDLAYSCLSVCWPVWGGRVGAVPALHRLRPVRAVLPLPVGADGHDPRLQPSWVRSSYTVVQILAQFNLKLAFKGLVPFLNGSVFFMSCVLQGYLLTTLVQEADTVADLGQWAWPLGQWAWPSWA